MPTLSEAESKSLLGRYGVPVPDDRVAAAPGEAAQAAGELGFPVVAKLCGATIAHKTERGLVRLGLRNDEEVAVAAADLLAQARPDDGDVAVLVARQVRGSRELIAGVHRDPQLGMTVMLGIGGVLAEVVSDVTFRLAPIEPVDVDEMVEDLRARSLLDAFRGQAAVNRDQLAAVLLGLSAAATGEPGLASIDVNPLIVTDAGDLVAVDALVELEG